MAAEHMTSTTDTTSNTNTSAFPDADKKTVQLVYILQSIGFVFGITFIAAVIVNYVKRGDITSEIGKSHFNYQIRTFWWSALWTFLSMILTFVIVGYITLLVAYVWTIYRVVRGFMRMNANQAI